MTDTTASNNKDNLYRVLARKYRPQNFDDLIGQEPMVQTLTNAFKIGRIAQAWMLTGVRGVGKTTTARILARALNYKTDTIDKPTINLEAMGEHCQAIMEGRHVDVIEMDAASHTGIDDIREIIEQVRYRPVSARYKVYIIDEVHMLSTQAFNGLLKTLEEPPPHVKFIFATTEIRKVPITVLSRCQRFDLRRIESHVLKNHLQKIIGLEHVEAEDKALSMIARAGEGSVRDALSILDQAIAHSGQKIEAEAVRSMLGLADRARIIDLFEYIMQGDVATALKELRNQYDAGADPLVILQELADFNHLVTRLRFTPDIAEDATLAEEERLRGLDFSQKLSVRILSRNWQMLLKALPEVDQAPSPIQAAEMLIIRLTHAADLPTLDETLKAIVDGKVNGAAPIATTSPINNHQTNNSGTAPTQHTFAQTQKQTQAQAKHLNVEAARETNTPAQPQSPKPELTVHNNMALAPQILEPAPTPIEAQNSINAVQDIIDLAEEHNDIHFKILIKEFLRPVAFHKNHIEIELATGAPSHFVQDLTKKLREWTGERIAVSVVNQGGGTTIREEEDKKQKELVSNAASDPEIIKFLNYFSGAKIVDVRLVKQDDEMDLSAEHYLLDNDENEDF